MYELQSDIWPTPRGVPAQMHYRADTSDWNTINSIMGTNDEYGLAGLTLVGAALDLGAYLGAAAIALALDNPGLRVIAVEPVPDNARLSRINVELNNLADRISVYEGAIGPPGIGTSLIRFGYRGDANLEHHAFVGNSSLAYDHGGDVAHDEREVETLGIAALLDRYSIATADFVKVDVEGAEFPFLAAPAADLRRLAHIIGEWHPVRGHVQSDVRGLLGGTHDVEFSGPDGGPGGFIAVRR